MNTTGVALIAVAAWLFGASVMTVILGIQVRKWQKAFSHVTTAYAELTDAMSPQLFQQMMETIKRRR